MAVWIGYLASVFLATSLMVNNELKFRWINMCGSFTFIIYGIFISATPVILTNSLLLAINAVRVYKTYQRQEKFDLYEFIPGEKIITKFLQFFDKDIQTYFPGFKLAGGDNDIRFIVLRDMAIANIFIAELTADGTAYVKINYTISKFRDFKVGRFIFEKEKEYLTAKGIKQIIYHSVPNKNHLTFLKKMGFNQEAERVVKVL